MRGRSCSRQDEVDLEAASLCERLPSDKSERQAGRRHRLLLTDGKCKLPLSRSKLLASTTQLATNPAIPVVEKGRKDEK
jgi:hypothetical protein